MHGWTLREKLKMSKSKGTQILREELIEGTLEELKKNKSYSKIKGVETFRFYSIGVTQPGRDFNFVVKEYADTYKIINTIWNVFVYANEKFKLAGFDPSKVKLQEKNLSKLDIWMISRLNSTIKRITELADNYKLPWITGELRELIVNDISRWYIMLNREKLDIYSEDPNKLTIMLVLFNTLFKVLLMLSPINPMISEEIFLKMFKPHLRTLNREETESIHLQNWPNYDETIINPELEKEMHFVQDLIEVIRALKEENKIRMRWPNKKIIIEPKEEMPDLTFPEIIKKIANVNNLEIKDGVQTNEDLAKAESKYCNIYLDKTVDDDLLAERVVNDLIRNIQFIRKKNGYKVEEKISLKIGANKAYLKDFLEKHQDTFKEKINIENLEIISEELTEEQGKIFAKLNICPNKECSASLKDNVITKLKKKAKVECPYCNYGLKENAINSVTFSFEKK